jgi:hypothetical protein
MIPKHLTNNTLADLLNVLCCVQNDRTALCDALMQDREPRVCHPLLQQWFVQTNCGFYPLTWRHAVALTCVLCCVLTCVLNRVLCCVLPRMQDRVP